MDFTPLLIGTLCCPRCQSTMTYVNGDGDLECITCGNVKTKLPPTTSREPHKRREIKDNFIFMGVRRALGF